MDVTENGGIGESFNGKTAHSDSVNLDSNPSSPTFLCTQVIGKIRFIIIKYFLLKALNIQLFGEKGEDFIKERFGL